MAKNIKDIIKMSKNKLLDEHIHLVKVLKSGSREEREKEAIEQSEEMKKYK